MTDDMKKRFSGYTSPETFAKLEEYGSVAEMWAHCVSEYSALSAVEDDGKTYTYGQLDRDTADMRALIDENVTDKGERVVILVPNSYAFVRAYLAVTTSGRTAVILPPQLPDTAVFGLSMKFGAKAVIYAPSLENSVAVCRAKGIPCINADGYSGKSAPAAEVGPDDPCAIMLTGGTTGVSKGALLSNRAIMQGTVNGCYGLSDVFGQRYLLVLPLFHVFGLIRNLMCSLYTGSDIFICRNNKDMFRNCAEFRPTVMVMVPALAEIALGLSRQFRKNMLGSDLRVIVCGAAAVPPYLISEYAKLGVNLLPGYGLTESANLVSGNPDALAKPESVGLLYPNQEYKLVDGELWLRGANMLTSYVGEPEPAYTEDGWFRTGDLARFDEDGYLYITGRIKEIIVLANGENVSPAEVEAKFSVLPLIQDCQVFEDADESGAHILALEVVPRASETAGLGSDAGRIITEKLREINETLPGYQQVRKITIRDSDFERTPSMKIKRYRKF